MKKPAHAESMVRALPRGSLELTIETSSMKPSTLDIIEQFKDFCCRRSSLAVSDATLKRCYDDIDMLSRHQHYHLILFALKKLREWSLNAHGESVRRSYHRQSTTEIAALSPGVSFTILILVRENSM